MDNSPSPHRSRKRSGSNPIDFRRFFNSKVFLWAVFIVWINAIALILCFRIDYLPSNIRPGRVVVKDIKADRNYEIIDLQATREKRRQAAENSLLVYDFDLSLVEPAEKKIIQAFKEFRSSEENYRNLDKIKGLVKVKLDIDLPPELLSFLVKNKFSVQVESEILRLFQELQSQKIIKTRNILPTAPQREIVLRIIKPEGNEESIVSDVRRFVVLDEVEDWLKQNLNSNFRIEGVIKPEIPQIVSRLVVPNTFFNLKETEARKQKAAQNVPDIIIKVQGGSAIVRAGDRFETYHLTILDEIRKQKNKTSFFVKFLGTELFSLTVILVCFFFAKKFVRKFRPKTTDLFFLGGISIILLLSMRLGAALSPGIRDLVPHVDIPTQMFYYAIPIAGGAMLVRYILNSETALIFTLIISCLAGIFLEGDLDLSVYYLISGIAAASAIAFASRRSAILRAGIIVGLVNALVILSIQLIHFSRVTDYTSPILVFAGALLGFLGGILSSIFVMVLAPVAEMIFDYVTDIKLLELGNLNHPLLKQMIMKAPGTYHHSQLVAVLAEAAAAEIGVNPLLARVGSYFHDIGKMRKPSYFIENQQGGENRHDKLSPSMSALIIASHVKDGIELAREYKLPKRVADFIPQHQGTKLISFFYKKAIEANPDPGTPVDENVYRYPGPKPLSKESGIVLLADGVEAAVRALPEKTPLKIQTRVSQMINKNLEEDQLSECDMTFKDLRIISDTFTRVLIGIYHQRIEYPDLEEKKATVTPISKKLSKI